MYYILYLIVYPVVRGRRAAMYPYSAHCIRVDVRGHGHGLACSYHSVPSGMLLLATARGVAGTVPIEQLERVQMYYASATWRTALSRRRATG